jgi:hypothetical protein
VYGTDKSGHPHGGHEFFPHRQSGEAVRCPGWTQQEADATWLASRLDQVARDAVWPMRLPAGVRLECHPAVPSALQQLYVPGLAEFTASLNTGEDLLKPQIPVMVLANLPHGWWRIIGDDGQIDEGVVRDG